LLSVQKQNGGVKCRCCVSLSETITNAAMLLKCDTTIVYLAI
jgi:hypothetical protein